MKVKELIKLLRKMPQDEEVGHSAHDYDCGDSDSIFFVSVVEDEDAMNEDLTVHHRVVIRS